MVIRIVEIDEDVGIGTYIEIEGRLGDFLSELLAHPLGHEPVIGLKCINSTDVMITYDSDERKSSELALEIVHHVGEHLLVNFSLAAVTLDEVTHLEDHPGVLVDKFSSTLDEPGTPFAPHLTVPCKLSPLDPVQPFHLLIIVGVVNIGGLSVKMSISKYDH